MMLSRVLAVAFGAVLSMLPRGAVAQDLTPANLAQWLCQAVLADRPEQWLEAFPGAQSARIESRVERLWSDRPGRLQSPTRYIWILTAGPFDVEYRHLERPGRKYQYSITIRPVVTSGGRRIFDSQEAMRRWLAPLGGEVSVEDGIVETPRPDGGFDRDLLIQPHIEAVGGRTGQGRAWRVTIGSDRPTVAVTWNEDVDKSFGRGFCKRQ
jgi:hypothetical protein